MGKLKIAKEATKALGWNYGSEGAGISLGVSFVGTAISGILGGWDVMVQALVWCMAADFALGFLAAVKARRVDSQTMFWGGINKILVLGLVALGVVFDKLAGMPEPYIRTAIIWFYIGREGLSLVENYGKMGLPLPGAVTQFLEQLKDKGDGRKEDGTEADTAHR